MQELIRRLTDLVEALGIEEDVRPGCREASMITSRDWARVRGMLDILLAMEGRCDSIRAAATSQLGMRCHAPPGLLELLERA